MKIQFFKSSTTVIESNGVKILTDPWLVDGEYYGSWYHVPPFEFDPSAFDDIDFIYISHIHPDHFSRETLKRLNNRIPVLIHSYEVKFLKRNIESLGYDVWELPNNERTELRDGVHINIFAADNCNPELCMKHFGCGRIESKYGSTQVDSLSVIDSDGYTVLNVNDCPFGLARHCEKEIREQYQSIDFMLVGYAGAGPYPQCFSNLSQEEKQNAAARKRAQFLKQGVDFLQLFQPRYFMPFAGTYTLGGVYAKLNSLRGVPEIDDALAEMNAQVKSQGMLLNTGEYFDLVSETASSDYQPYDRDEKNRYVSEVLAAKPFDFETDPLPNVGEFLPLLPAAHERMDQVRQSISFETQTRVIVDLPEGRSVVLRLNEVREGESPWEIISTEMTESLEPSVRFSVDPRLLLRILKGPRFGHWNNAEIGSHILFDRKPDQFERGLYYCMNFFFAG